MTALQWTEVLVGFGLIVVASYVIVRPAYRRGRVLLGMAAAAWAVGLFGVLDAFR